MARTNPNIAAEASSPIPFTWTDNGDTYSIELATDSEFTADLFQTPLSPCESCSSESVAVPAGTYYYRITATGGGETQTFTAESPVTIE